MPAVPSHAEPRRSSRTAVVAVVAALAVGVISTSVMVARMSQAAFAGTTGNSANAWLTGTVALSDNDSGSALFRPADGAMLAGEARNRCIAVTYTGSLTTGVAVKFYGSARELTTGADLRPYLNVKIERGTGGLASAGSCSGFSPLPGPAVFDGTLSALTASSYVSGLDPWTPSSSSDTQVYRFTVTLDTDPAAGEKDAVADFTWEARSS
jgi:hypothetical protein